MSMHVEVTDTPTKSKPIGKKRKYILIGSIIGFLICMGIGIFILLTPPEPVVDNTVYEVPHFHTNFTYETGIIPAAYGQHLIKYMRCR